VLRWGSALKTLVIALVALFAVGPAFAQSVGEIEIGAGNPFLKKKAGDHLSKIQGALRQVLTRVEEARNEKDIVKLNCVNEKLAQIKHILSVAEGAEVALQEAIAKGDDGADAEYSKIAIARGKADQLRAEADECIGQLAFVVDEKTSVEVQQPEGLPEQTNLSSDAFGNVAGGDEGARDEAGGLFDTDGAGGAPSRPPAPVVRPRAASASW